MCVCASCRAPQTEVPEEEGGRLAQRHMGFFLSPCLSVVPPPALVCVWATDGRTGPLPQENHSCLLFSHAAGGRHSIRPSPSRRARPSGLDSGVPAMLCVCSVFVLGVFLSVCKKGGLGARFALARHRSAAACIWSWGLGLGSWVLLWVSVRPAHELFPFPEPAV